MKLHSRWNHEQITVQEVGCRVQNLAFSGLIPRNLEIKINKTQSYHVRSEVLTTLIMKNVTPCKHFYAFLLTPIRSLMVSVPVFSLPILASLFSTLVLFFYPEDGATMFLRNSDNDLADSLASHTRRPPWEPNCSQCTILAQMLMCGLAGQDI